MPVAAIIDEKVLAVRVVLNILMCGILQIFCIHGGLSPDLNDMDQVFSHE